MEKQSQQKKFKFCYIMQGLPGSGKSTVAKQLAGENGKVFSLDTTIASKKQKITHLDQSSIQEIYDQIFQEFSAEIEKGTETIVIDNTNLSEWEYLRFVQKGQLEHYFVSIVTLPPPSEIQTAVQRSNFDVNDDEMTQMLARWEPFSPQRLLDKTLQMQGDGGQQYHRRASSSDISSMKRPSKANITDVINEQQAEEEEDAKQVTT